MSLVPLAVAAGLAWGGAVVGAMGRAVPVPVPTAPARDGTGDGRHGSAPPGEGHVDGDSTELFLSARRIATLPRAARLAWTRYLQTSDRFRKRDRASMNAELRQTGKAAMTPSPSARYFRLGPEMTEAWFRGEEARRGADNMLTFQTPSGGWSKRVDVLTRPRAPGESYFSENDKWTYIATLDNDSTTEEIRFLAAVAGAHAERRYRDGVRKGIDFLLRAQFPSGCWPQGFPLQGGYHDAATFNDNATINVLRLLSDVAAGKVPFLPAATRREAGAAVDAGVACVLNAQVIIDGVRTVWGQQHDPITLAPVAARSYEPAGLAGRESAWITQFLMTLPAPNPRVVAAVDAAVAWFRAHQIHGYEYENYQLRKVAGAGPLWARLTEIETGKPIFSNRDGIKLYDWNGLTDRRQGYGWFSKEPAAVIEEHARWAGRERRTPPADAAPAAVGPRPLPKQR